MRPLVFSIAILLLSDLILFHCANPMSPQGGPKDTIPPVLITSYPPNGATNFKEQTIQLEFSEYINADQLSQNLIITPKSEIKFKHVVKRELLTIKFEEPFADSTTFSLNFFDGITDITEKSPVVNLILAFSTGSFIDSAKVSGHVEDLFTQKHAANFTVGLYPSTDTLDFLKDTPLYFTTTSDSGEFNISYIKQGSYKILAFNDENRNLILDTEEEDHGFLAQILELNDSVTNINIPTLIQDIKPIKIINYRSIGLYNEIRFNKVIDSYKIQPDSIKSNIVGENNNIVRIYNPQQFPLGDSLSIIISANDSITNTVVDTLKMAFSESSRKPLEFKYSVNYKNETLVDDPIYHFDFNKPIVFTNDTCFTFSADSTFDSKIDSLNFIWNYNSTKLELQTFLNKDSLYYSYESQLPKDSILIDSVLVPPPVPSPIEFNVLKGAFISVEEDTSKIESITHAKNIEETYGTLKLKINTSEQSYTLQLLQGEEVAYQVTNDPAPTFQVEPATYQIRVLIDTNQDGKWSYGNLLRDQEPEKVYLFDEEVSVRENWIVEDIEINF